MKEEIWRDIPGYEGIYQASDIGRVKVLNRECISTGCGGKIYSRMMPEKIMKQSKNSNSNHKWVCLAKNGVSKRWGVHALVLLAFEGTPLTPGLFCLHKDDISDNNIPSNLYWGTHLENMKDAIRNGGSIQAYRHPHTKLNDTDVIKIKKRLAAGETPTEISRDYKVHQAVIRCIKIGRNWSHVKLEEVA